MDQLEDIVEKDPSPAMSMEVGIRFQRIQIGQQKLGSAYEAKKIVVGKDFWKKAADIIEPLVKKLRLIDSDEEPTMGFIYEVIDRAKRAIKENCRLYSQSSILIWGGAFCQYIVENIRRLDSIRLLTFRGKHETFSTPQAQIVWSLMNPSVDPLSEWLQEKENPLLDGENAGLFPADSSYDEINVVDQSEEQNLYDSSSSATPTHSGGDRQDSGTGGLSPIYDDDRESGDRGEIRSSRLHGEEYEIGFAGGRFRHMSEFGGNMSVTPSIRERSESRTRSKENGKGNKMHTSEGFSSHRRSTSSNPGYTDSSTSTHDFYPPDSGQYSYSQPPHGYYPFLNYGMPMPYHPQMYLPPPIYQLHPPHMYPPPPMY
ncbi:hypothetical protein GQ457_02G039760 [Hibiscus cannabinus]